jgi:membrane fusion protein, multidrug efflux system
MENRQGAAAPVAQLNPAVVPVAQLNPASAAVAQHNSAPAVAQLNIAPAPEPDLPRRPGFFARYRKIMILAVVVLGMLGGAAYFVYDQLTFVSTDNATVQAHTVMLSFRVPGVVTKVNVDENQRVKQGDVLVELDSRDYQNALDQAQAQVGALQARLETAQKNFERMQALIQRGSVPQQQFDQAKSDRDTLQRQLAAAQASADQAKLNSGYTEMTAPEDGTIAKRAVEVGMLAPVGQPMLGFVESKERWVLANFKETDLDDVRVGRKAEVTVDAIPGRVFEGVVESLSPSTGATFTLLPPDNATGNFTKVVQRVPVRVQLLHLTPADVTRLQAGLSAVVKVRVR